MKRFNLLFLLSFCISYANGQFLSNEVGFDSESPSDTIIICEGETYRLILKGSATLGTSVRWAAYNIGATKPEETGNYFAWGEITPKMVYDYDTYKYASEPYHIYKYLDKIRDGAWGCGDDKYKLDLYDDAAYMNWGSEWRIPTLYDWHELWDHTFMQRGYYNNQLGYYVYSEETHEAIFLPSTGAYSGNEILNKNCGYYWSSYLSIVGRAYPKKIVISDAHKAMALTFDGSGVYTEEWTRTLGFAVRPVSNSKVKNKKNKNQ